MTGLPIFLAALVKGELFLFARVKDGESDYSWDVDWGGIVIAFVVFAIGLALVDKGFEVKDEVNASISEEG